VYTREAHPGERFPHHTSMEQKLASAREMVDRFDISRRMLVDALDGPVHRAYGLLPNMTIIVSRRGRVLYRANWTDPRNIACVLAEMRLDHEARARRERRAPFYAEWLPTRERDRPAFYDAMRRGGGERAVEEFIGAIEATQGKGAADAARRIAASVAETDVDRDGAPQDPATSGES